MRDGNDGDLGLRVSRESHFSQRGIEERITSLARTQRSLRSVFLSGNSHYIRPGTTSSSRSDADIPRHSWNISSIPSRHLTIPDPLHAPAGASLDMHLAQLRASFDTLRIEHRESCERFAEREAELLEELGAQDVLLAREKNRAIKAERRGEMMGKRLEEFGAEEWETRVLAMGKKCDALEVELAEARAEAAKARAYMYDDDSDDDNYYNHGTAADNDNGDDGKGRLSNDLNIFENKKSSLASMMSMSEGGKSKKKGKRKAAGSNAAKILEDAQVELSSLRSRLSVSDRERDAVTADFLRMVELVGTPSAIGTAAQAGGWRSRLARGMNLADAVSAITAFHTSRRKEELRGGLNAKIPNAAFGGGDCNASRSSGSSGSQQYDDRYHQQAASMLSGFGPGGNRARDAAADFNNINTSGSNEESKNRTLGEVHMTTVGDKLKRFAERIALLESEAEKERINRKAIEEFNEALSTENEVQRAEVRKLRADLAACKKELDNEIRKRKQAIGDLDTAKEEAREEAERLTEHAGELREQLREAQLRYEEALKIPVRKQRSLRADGKVEVRDPWVGYWKA